jgi:hypothetical protein
VCDGSMLKQKLISVDEEEWQQLGEKVGFRNRSQWIREQIHEMVKLPDTKEAIEQELDNLSSTTNRLIEKLETMEEKEYKEFKELGETEERFKKAMMAVKDSIKEMPSNKRDDYGQLIKGPDGRLLMEQVVGQDKIKEIAVTYKINEDELTTKIHEKFNIKLIKYHEGQYNQTQDNKQISRLMR